MVIGWLLMGALSLGAVTEPPAKPPKDFHAIAENIIFSPEFAVAVALTIGGLTGSMVKGVIIDHSNLKRLDFEERLKTKLSEVIKEGIDVLEEKLKPQIREIYNDLRQIEILYNTQDATSEQLKASIQELEKKVEVIIMRNDMLLDNINQKISQVLTAYLGESVKVNLFADDLRFKR